MSLLTRALCDRCGFVLMHCQCQKITDELIAAGFKVPFKALWISTQQGPGHGMSRCVKWADKV